MPEAIYVTSPSMPPFSEYSDLIKEIWTNHWLTNMGKFHQEFQLKLQEYLSVDNVDLFTNGHMALELSLQALLENVEKGAEIITTPFTFISTTHAIIRAGFKPIFCDINLDDFTIDASKIEPLINEQTCAIVPVHVYGNVCNVEEIERIAKKHGLKVIYDAAHAFGVRYKGKSVAHFGDISIFSFHATKVFNSIEGGAACIKDKDVAEKIYHLKNFGITSPERVEYIGTNAKMNEFCAAMGICNLKYLEENIAKRRRIYEKYIECLSDVQRIEIHSIQDNTEANYSYFPLLFTDEACRDRVFRCLAEHSIYARKYFYPLTSSFECFSFDENETPIALDVSGRILTLPIYSRLSLAETERICEIMRSCLGYEKAGSS
ncbi:MAG: DegT/DnrJ/EryC1/StrS family aminotransferase [Synergistaceae bacterium]|nr:DegT/DnrJ/EryC1/StrS family aminotransferase [Synergistaceae bacterium]